MSHIRICLLIVTLFVNTALPQSGAASRWLNTPAQMRAQSLARLQEQAPDLFERTRACIQESDRPLIGGSWSRHVDHLASGEALVRQYLYGKGYFRENFGVEVTRGCVEGAATLPPSLPQILRKCGLAEYIMFQPQEKESLFCWQSPDGSTVQVYRLPTPPDSGISHDMLARMRTMAARPDTVRGELCQTMAAVGATAAISKRPSGPLEPLLAMAETFSVFARRCSGVYPQQELSEAWREFLPLQALEHSCGTEQEQTAAQTMHTRSDTLAQRVLRRALRTIGRQADTRPPRPDLLPLLLFNHLNWPRQEPVTINLPAAPEQDLRFFDLAGKPLSCVRQADGSCLVMPPPVPAFGYTTIFYKIAAPERTNPSQRNLILQNRFLRVEVDYRTGHVVSIYDRRLAQELLYGRGNLLQLQQDRNDAITLNKPVSTRIMESNPLRKVMRVHYADGPSRFEQEIILYADLARVDFALRADWRHRNTTLKIAFPVNVNGRTVSDIPFGHSLQPPTGAEVVLQKWLDVSNSRYGVTLLSDRPCGFTVRENQLSLNALRSPQDRAPATYEGEYEMRYALYGHNGDWRQGASPRQAASYQAPLYAWPAEVHPGPLAAEHSFIKMDGQDVLIAACKKSEQDDAIVLRLQELYGGDNRVQIKVSEEMAGLLEMNMVEEKIRELPAAGMDLSLRMLPYEVRTLALYMKKGPNSP